MLADVTQKTEHIQPLRPVEIIDYQCGIGAVEIDELTDLLPDAIHPISHYIRRVQLPLCRLKTGVADKPRSAAHQGNRAVPGFLKAT